MTKLKGTMFVVGMAFALGLVLALAGCGGSSPAAVKVSNDGAAGSSAGSSAAGSSSGAAGAAGSSAAGSSGAAGDVTSSGAAGASQGGAGAASAGAGGSVGAAGSAGSAGGGASGSAGAAGADASQDGRQDAGASAGSDGAAGAGGAGGAAGGAGAGDPGTIADPACQTASAQDVACCAAGTCHPPICSDNGGRRVGCGGKVKYGVATIWTGACVNAPSESSCCTGCFDAQGNCRSGHEDAACGSLAVTCKSCRAGYGCAQTGIADSWLCTIGYP